MTEDQARKTYDRAMKLEQEFGEYFTGKNIHFLNYLILKCWVLSVLVFSSRCSGRHTGRNLRQSQGSDSRAIRAHGLGSSQRQTLNCHRLHQKKNLFLDETSWVVDSPSFLTF
jgi:hypothetical protein